MRLRSLSTVLLAWCLSLYASQKTATVSAYKNTDNVIVKKRLLSGLFRESGAQERPPAPWKAELLLQALHDKSPLVVEEALRQIKKGDIRLFNREVRSIFCNAYPLFGTYADRIRVAVLPLLGTMRDTESSALLRQYLDNDNGSAIAPEILDAVASTRDVTLYAAVRSFAERMERHADRLKSASRDPIFYRHLLWYGTRAHAVAQSLHDRQDGSYEKYN